MLQLKNNTPFKATITLFPNEAGIDTLYVIVKATFSLDASLQIKVADEQLPLTMADEYWGKPGASSLKYASDAHLCKPATDVVLVGQAWSPGGKVVPWLDVGLAVAERKKLIRVFGDRTWAHDGKQVSTPKPFETMPLVYERAFGGVHVVDGETPKVLAEERNPVGAGFRGARADAEIAGLPLPNLEDPAGLVQQVGDKAVPACFGFVAPNWQPRRGFAGTYDAAWQQNRSPYLPEDFDGRFVNAAHPDLIFDNYLQGGEPIQLLHLCSEPRIGFALPMCRLDAEVQVAGSPERPPLNLETLLIEPDDARFSMTWRGQVQCDKKALKVEQVTINLADLELTSGKT